MRLFLIVAVAELACSNKKADSGTVETDADTDTDTDTATDTDTDTDTGSVDCDMGEYDGNYEIYAAADIAGLSGYTGVSGWLWISGEVKVNAPWHKALRHSAGLAPEPAVTPEAVVQVYAARAFRWRGVYAEPPGEPSTLTATARYAGASCRTM